MPHHNCYPPQWDDPETPDPETERAYCHADLVEADTPCYGCFVQRTIRIRSSERVFDCFCCEDCGELRTEEELIELAIETYGEDWAAACTRTISADDESELDYLAAVYGIDIYSSEASR